MRDMKTKNLYEIYEIPVFQFFIRLLCLGWIYFCYYMYAENQMFFLIVGILAFLLIFLLPKFVLIATKDFLILEKRFWLPFLNKTKKWTYNDIIEFRYEKANMLANFLIMTFGAIIGFGTPESSKLILKIKGKRIKTIPAVGCHEENEDIVKVVNREIKRLNK